MLSRYAGIIAIAGGLFGIVLCGCAGTPSAATGSAHQQTAVGFLPRAQTHNSLARTQSTTETVLYRFKPGTDAESPAAGVIIDTSGALYGTGQLGGSGNCYGSGCGAVFKLTRSGSSYSESVIYSFTGGTDGWSPEASLVENKGVLFGTADAGGAKKGGTVFTLRPSGGTYKFHTVYSFGQRGDGEYPEANVFIDSQGSIFGTTHRGGIPRSGKGIAFQLTRDGNTWLEHYVHDFSGNEGAYPTAGLIADGSGDLFGTTYNGGGCGAGTVYKLTPSGSSYVESVLYDFQDCYSNQDGRNPNGPLIEDANGGLYGTTAGDGFTGCGTVFKLTPQGSNYKESLLYIFNCGSDGQEPIGGLVADAQGDLYGTTVRGGNASCDSGCGVVFKLTPSGSGYVESVAYAFAGGSDGAHPFAGLVADTKGLLYGTTSGGGNTGCNSVGGCGTVFRITP